MKRGDLIRFKRGDLMKRGDLIRFKSGALATVLEVKERLRPPTMWAVLHVHGVNRRNNPIDGSVEWLKSITEAVVPNP